MQTDLVLKYLQFFAIGKDYVVLNVTELKKCKHVKGMWSFNVVQKRHKVEHPEIKFNCYLEEHTYHAFINWLHSFKAWVILDNKNKIDSVSLSEESAREIVTDNNEKIEEYDDMLHFIETDLIF